MSPKSVPKSIAAMEPMLPDLRSSELAALSQQTTLAIGELNAHPPAELARNRQRYFDRLQAADRKRENDFDGRGNLSTRHLFEFCRFFLSTLLDQVEFMNGLLNLKDLRFRIERYFRYEALHLGRHQEAIGAIVAVLACEGEIPRERVKTVTGMQSTTVASIIKRGLAEGYFTSPSPKGVLQFAVPEKTWASYFPQLFIDLPEDG